MALQTRIRDILKSTFPNTFTGSINRASFGHQILVQRATTSLPDVTGRQEITNQNW